MNNRYAFHRLHLALIAGLLCCFTSCGGGEVSPTGKVAENAPSRGGKKFHSPELYQEYVNGVNEKVSEEMDQLVNEIAEGAAPDDIEKKYQTLKKLIDESKTEITTLEDFENNPSLKEEAVKTLAVYDSTVNTDLHEMITIIKKGDLITASDSLKLRRMAIHISTELQNQDIRYQNIENDFQQQYAAPLPRQVQKDSLR